MPRSGLSYAAVKEAAQRLTEQGLAPTVMRVRAEVGGTGSLTTIAKHLKDWRVLTGQSEQTGPLGHAQSLALTSLSAGMPELGVPPSVAEVAKTAWQQLSELATAEIERAKEACATDIEQAKNQAQEAVASCSQQADAAVEAARQQQALESARLAEVLAGAARDRQTIAGLQAEARAKSVAVADLQATQRAQSEAAALRIADLEERLSRTEVKGQQAIEARDSAVARQRSSEAQCQARLDKLAHIEQQRLLSVSEAYKQTLLQLRGDAERAAATQTERAQRTDRALAAVAERLAANNGQTANLAEQLAATMAAAVGAAQRQEAMHNELQRCRQELARLTALEKPLQSACQQLSNIVQLQEETARQTAFSATQTQSPGAKGTVEVDVRGRQRQ